MLHKSIAHENTCCKFFVAINIVFIDLYVLIPFVWKCAFLKIFDFTTFKHNQNITNFCSMNCVDKMLDILHKKWRYTTNFSDYVHLFKIPPGCSKHTDETVFYTYMYFLHFRTLNNFSYFQQIYSNLRSRKIRNSFSFLHKRQCIGI